MGYIEPPLFYPGSLYLPLQQPQNKRLIVEIGPGNGDFLFFLAENNKDAVVCGVEIKPRRFFKLIAIVEKFNIKNISLIRADARAVLKPYFAPATISEIYINFPDPWPKNKHRGNRLFTKEFINTCRELLMPGGRLFLATDVKWYAEDAAKTVSVVKEFQPSNEDLSIYPTFYAQKWKKEGRSFYSHQWIRS